MDDATSAVFKSPILNKVIRALPTLANPVAAILGDLNTKKATEGKMSELWNDPEKYPSVLEAQLVCILLKICNESGLYYLTVYLDRRI